MLGEPHFASHPTDPSLLRCPATPTPSRTLHLRRPLLPTPSRALHLRHPLLLPSPLLLLLQVANTVASLPFIFLISALSTVSVYWLANLRNTVGDVWFFILQLFAALVTVESMVRSSCCCCRRRHCRTVLWGWPVLWGGQCCGVLGGVPWGPWPASVWQRLCLPGPFARPAACLLPPPDPPPTCHPRQMMAIAPLVPHYLMGIAAGAGEPWGQPPPSHPPLLPLVQRGGGASLSTQPARGHCSLPLLLGTCSFSLLLGICSHLSLLLGICSWAPACLQG